VTTWTRQVRSSRPATFLLRPVPAVHQPGCRAVTAGMVQPVRRGRRRAVCGRLLQRRRVVHGADAHGRHHSRAQRPASVLAIDQHRVRPRPRILGGVNGQRYESDDAAQPERRKQIDPPAECTSTGFCTRIRCSANDLRGGRLHRTGRAGTWNMYRVYRRLAVRGPEVGDAGLEPRRWAGVRPRRCGADGSCSGCSRPRWRSASQR
jgi:hypothetical protein